MRDGRREEENSVEQTEKDTLINCALSAPKFNSILEEYVP